MKLIRDKLGSPIPQYMNLDLQFFAVETTDGSVVTVEDYDFSKTKLLRDELGSPIPQLWDPVNLKWVERTTQNGSGGVSSWNDLTDKPLTFPSTIFEVDGLDNALNSKANSTDLTSLSNTVTTHLDEMKEKISGTVFVDAYAYLKVGNDWSPVIQYIANHISNAEIVLPNEPIEMHSQVLFTSSDFKLRGQPKTKNYKYDYSSTGY